MSFARAFLADPAVLILDEATSSLDVPSERLVQHALRTLLEDRTAVIIAHRLTTVEIADRVIVVDAGRIVEDGAPATSSAATAATPPSTSSGSRAWRERAVRPRARPSRGRTKPTPADEMAMARAWLTHLRESAIYKLDGLTDEQLRWAPTPDRQLAGRDRRAPRLRRAAVAAGDLRGRGDAHGLAGADVRAAARWLVGRRRRRLLPSRDAAADAVLDAAASFDDRPRPRSGPPPSAGSSPTSSRRSPATSATWTSPRELFDGRTGRHPRRRSVGSAACRRSWRRWASSRRSWRGCWRTSTRQGWATPSACAGWSVADVVLHLAQTNEMAIGSAQGDLDGAMVRLTEGLAPTDGDIDDGAALMVAHQRGAPTAELHERWLRSSTDLRAALLACDPGDRLTWVAGELAARTLGDHPAGGDVDPHRATSPRASASSSSPPSACGTSPASPGARSPTRSSARASSLRAPSPSASPARAARRGTSATTAPTTISGSGYDLCRVASRRVPVTDTDLASAGPTATPSSRLIRTWA